MIVAAGPKTLDELLAIVPGLRRVRLMNAPLLRALLDRHSGECTWCGAAVPKGRQTWCGKQCVEAFHLRCSPGHQRPYVLKRDGGICRLCGRDVLASERQAKALRLTGWKPAGPERDDFLRQLAELGYARGCFYEVDHDPPVIMGGGLCPVESLRLVCGVCHYRETSELAWATIEAKGAAMSLENLYKIAAAVPSDVNEHVPVLRRYASMVKSVWEFGTGSGNSTAGLLAGLPERLATFDVAKQPCCASLAAASEQDGVAFAAWQADVLKGNCFTLARFWPDLLFIDTLHTGEQLAAELKRWGDMVRYFIILHDTVTFGLVGEDGCPGLASARPWFAEADRERGWRLIENLQNCNGLQVWMRKRIGQ